MGGADLPALSQIPKFPHFALQTHAEIGWLFMYVHYGPFTKTRVSYVPRFNFGGLFFDKKSDFQIANFQFFSIFAKNADFSKSSQGYIFLGRWLCFEILTLYIQVKNPG